jgi:hypothetical protein
MADCNGVPFFRLLFSADLFSDAAIVFALRDEKIFFSRSSALLVAFTLPDHFFLDVTVKIILNFNFVLEHSIEIQNGCQKRFQNSKFKIQNSKYSYSYRNASIGSSREAF